MAAADMIEALRTLLPGDGIELRFGEHRFRALVRRVPSARPAYELTPADDTTIEVRALRTDLPSGPLPRVGDSFVVVATDERLSIIGTGRQLGQPVVLYHCALAA